jgi:hypothetical protein
MKSGGRDEEEADAKAHLRGGHDSENGHTRLSLAPRPQKHSFSMCRHRCLRLGQGEVEPRHSCSTLLIASCVTGQEEQIGHSRSEHAREW